MFLVLVGFDFFDHLAQFPQGEILDLTDAFAGDAEFLADLLQGFFGPPSRPKR